MGLEKAYSNTCLSETIRMGYRLALEINQPDRDLYLAIPLVAHEAFFQREFAQLSLERYQIKHIVYDPINEVITQWIN